MHLKDIPKWSTFPLPSTFVFQPPPHNALEREQSLQTVSLKIQIIAF